MGLRVNELQLMIKAGISISFLKSVAAARRVNGSLTPDLNRSPSRHRRAGLFFDE